MSAKIRAYCPTHKLSFVPTWRPEGNCPKCEAEKRIVITGTTGVVPILFVGATI